MDGTSRRDKRQGWWLLNQEKGQVELREVSQG